MASDEPLYRWDIEVSRKNEYGDRIVERTPAIIYARTRSEVTEKVNKAFEAKYDEFRKFNSHIWSLNSVTEVQP